MISPEVGGIDGDHANRARDAEPDDAPVVAALRPAPAPSLPPVHPFPAIGVLALDEHGSPGGEQVVPGREEFVRRDERLPADARGGEIDETLVRHRSHLPMTPLGKSPSLYTHTPRTNVWRTTPASVIPA